MDSLQDSNVGLQIIVVNPRVAQQNAYAAGWSERSPISYKLTLFNTRIKTHNDVLHASI